MPEDDERRRWRHFVRTVLRSCSQSKPVFGRPVEKDERCGWNSADESLSASQAGSVSVPAVGKVDGSDLNIHHGGCAPFLAMDLVGAASTLTVECAIVGVYANP